MSTYTVIKDPGPTKLSYTIDWSDWLANDTISISDWAITSNTSESPISLSVDSSTISADTTVSPNVSAQLADVVLSGGNPGVSYEARNRVTTAAGYICDRTILVKVWNR